MKKPSGQMTVDDYRLPEIEVRLCLREKQAVYSQIPISDPQAAVAIMQEIMHDLDREMLCVVNLDTALRPVSYNVVSIGSIDMSIAPIPNILRVRSCRMPPPSCCSITIPAGILFPVLKISKLQRKRSLPPDEFLKGIRNMVEDLTRQAGTIPEEERNRFGTQKGREQVGTCPRCGAPVYEGKKSFYCSSHSCTFCLWKENKWLSGMRKTINTDMAKSLLADGRVHVTGLYSRKKNRNFNADLLIRDKDDRVGFRLEFPK